MSKETVIHSAEDIEDAIDELSWMTDRLQNYAYAGSKIKKDFENQLKDCQTMSEKYGIPFVAPEFAPEGGHNKISWSTSSLDC